MLSAIILQQYGRRPGSFYGVMVAIGVVMALCGWVAHHWWIISKIQATPTWLFYCCAMFFPAVALLHYLCDVKGKAHWFAIIKPAGTLTLTCYMVPYLTGNLMRLLELHWPSFTYSGGAGLVRCALYSLAAIWIAWLLSKIHIRLKI